MLNNVVLVGRLTNEPKIKLLENGIKNTIITLAIPRSYKNEYGIYETDFVDIILFSNLTENTIEYCKKGDIIGIKGRIQTTTEENENKEKRKLTNIIADKVTFLSTSTQNTNN